MGREYKIELELDENAILDLLNLLQENHLKRYDAIHSLYSKIMDDLEVIGIHNYGDEINPDYNHYKWNQVKGELSKLKVKSVFSNY